MTSSVLLVGVGGQGTILASKLLTEGLMQAGYDVKMSEIHGMSQRGGAVSSQVRYGEQVLSPVIELGGADILVSFELMEALRWLEYLKPAGRLIVNDFKIAPMPVVSSEAVYSDNILAQLQAAADTTVIDAAAIARELGNPRVMNIVLLGAAVKELGLAGLGWEQIIRDNVKPAFTEVNIAAFQAGLAAVQ
ncbi:MAG: indolepyruvate oxidoreductase subunit beta [Bacillota bacterium]|nr:indolepyruvate oxidoreductase subunit beta [Bacillota bacterium]